MFDFFEQATFEAGYLFLAAGPLRRQAPHGAQVLLRCRSRRLMPNAIASFVSGQMSHMGFTRFVLWANFFRTLTIGNISIQLGHRSSRPLLRTPGSCGEGAWFLAKKLPPTDRNSAEGACSFSEQLCRYYSTATAAFGVAALAVRSRTRRKLFIERR